MSSLELTYGCITQMHESDAQTYNTPVIVQVLDIRKIESKNAAASTANAQGDRYRLVISDSQYYIQGMLASQLNHLVVSDKIKTGCLVRLNSYIVNNVQGRKVIIMVEMEVLSDPVSPIGDAQNIMTVVKQETAIPVNSATSSSSNAMLKDENMGGATKGFQPQNQMKPMPFAGKPMVTPTPGAVQYHPIASLNPYHNRWTIKARVTAKSERKTWNNARGEGALFSVDLLDASGGQIRATMFNDACAKFYDVFQVNEVYIISKGVLKIANKKYSRLPCDYEITLNGDAEVIHVGQDDTIQSQKFEFVPVEALSRVEPNEFVDIIGVVTSVSPIGRVTSQKTQQELTKRVVTLMDRSLHSVDLTLWGEAAEKYNEQMLDNQPVIAVKNCRVSDFGGRSLSSGYTSQYFINPVDRAEAQELKAWFDTAGRDMIATSTNVSKQGRGAADGGQGSNRDQRKVLNDIKEENMGYKEKPDWLTVRAVVTFFKTGSGEKDSPPWYLACPGENCSKKVTADGPEAYRCDRCNRLYPTYECRYILSLMISDSSTSVWTTAFNDTAGTLLNGTTARTLQDFKDQGNTHAYNSVFKTNTFKQYVFKIRAKAEMGQDQEQRVRANIASITPVNFVSESKILFDEIAKYN